MNTAREVTARLQDLLRDERHALAEFILALAEFDERRLWVELDYTSLFYFLHRELGLSKGAAHYRKTAAELVQRFPEIVEPLRDGRLWLTTVIELEKVLTPENAKDVLPRFLGLSKREAQEVAAELRPTEVVPRREVVTTVRAPAAPALALELPAAVDRGHESVHLANQKPAPEPAPARPLPAPGPARTRDSVEPLTGEESRFHLTVSRRFLKKLEAARDALSHSNPGADTEEILEAGLDLLLERQAKRNGVATKPLRTPRPSSDPGYVPAHVRRAVRMRDEGRCQWPMPSGGTCGSTRQLELDHVNPRALGGLATVDDCRLLCRPHHLESARKAFGDAWMDRFTPNPRAGPAGRREPRRDRDH